MKTMSRTMLLLAALLMAVSLVSAQTAQRGLMMVSIDGMRPDYVTAADEHHLKIPNLRQIAKTGASATKVIGVLPTVTYPSHTTLVTGVWPSKHGIPNNVAFDPTEQNLDGWNWYFEDIRVPTLWDAAAHAGSINFVIPEFWRARDADDSKLMRAVSTPGLIAELEPRLGPYLNDSDTAIQTDWSRTHYAEAMVRAKHARFVTVHLAALDHIEHDTGPFSAQSNAALEEIDQMVGVLSKAMRDEAPAAGIAIVSDHGFDHIERRVNLRTALVKAGLLTPNPKPAGILSPGVTEWKAEAWPASASFIIVLKNRSDKNTGAAVEKLLHELAANPANGIQQVLNRKEIAALGGSQSADFWVDLKSGFAAGGSLTGPLVIDIKPGGTHGYSPSHPEMRAAFLMAGPGIQPGLNVGEIDMRSIAPTLAKFLAVPFPSADLPALGIFH
jgi:predicted AlkP superfamily pyrophosphatase or phosphodiesterase